MCGTFQEGNENPFTDCRTTLASDLFDCFDQNLEDDSAQFRTQDKTAAILINKSCFSPTFDRVNGLFW